MWSSKTGGAQGAAPTLISDAADVTCYCWPAGLAAGFAAATFTFGAQKSGSAVRYSFGGLLIFGLIVNIVFSVLITVSVSSLLYRARLSAPKASAMLMAPGSGSMDLSE